MKDKEYAPHIQNTWQKSQLVITTSAKFRGRKSPVNPGFYCTGMRFSFSFKLAKSYSKIISTGQLTPAYCVDKAVAVLDSSLSSVPSV